LCESAARAVIIVYFFVCLSECLVVVVVMVFQTLTSVRGTARVITSVTTRTAASSVHVIKDISSTPQLTAPVYNIINYYYYK